jgi:hypothetical protein
MIWHISVPDDGPTKMRLDEEAIDYFIDGLEELRHADPGQKFTTPSIVQDSDGVPSAATEFILERAEE